MTSAWQCTKTHLPSLWHTNRLRGGSPSVWLHQGRTGHHNPSFHSASRHSHNTATRSPGEQKSQVKQDVHLVSPLSAFAQKRALDVQKFQYPRASTQARCWSIEEFVARFDTLGLTPGQEAQSTESSVIQGRVQSIRTAGGSLCFIDIAEWSVEARRSISKSRVQVVAEKKNLLKSSDSTGVANPIKRLARELNRGDYIRVTGTHYISPSGEPSIRADRLPEILAPCLHDIPAPNDAVEPETPHARHVEMLVDDDAVRTIIQRSRITTAISEYLCSAGFLSVQTPILAANAGGATARPFQTTATEFADRKLALRIAPELWLKRLVVGGLQRVFEIGPSFRNEGLDKTHNPEFTTCEFYAMHWTRSDLMQHTQNMFARINVLLGSESSPAIASIGLPADGPWPTIDFIPALNQALGLSLPSLTADTARQNLLAMFEQKNISLPPRPTLPRLLDKLSSTYLEPLCDRPTWIINTPECLSPLAKSFPHPDLPQHIVAARAELFINNKEIVNCYEEENSPFEQRRKFVDQQRHAKLDGSDTVDDEAHVIDEEYIAALEWGLPPTGGWGCGVDRLVMLFMGKERIRDVLTFGDLRTVTRGAAGR